MKSVLIFESDDSIRMVLKRLVESEGYLVFTADTWEEAFEKLKIIQISKPDDFVVLADISFDGSKLIEAISNSVEYSSIPVIPMSTGKEQECHGKKVLKKPIVFDELITLVKKHNAT